jgi:hypothetical protein
VSVETITKIIVPARCEESSSELADPYDLTDLVTVHDELSIPITDTSNDAFLSRAITQASKTIANYCNRVFALEGVQDQIFLQQDPYPWQVPGGVDALQLSRWPAAASGVVTFTGNTHGSIVIDGIVSTAGICPGMLVFSADGSLSAGARVSSVAPKSLILTQPATTTESGVSFSTGVQVVQTLSVGQPQTLVYGQNFTIDAQRGWLIRLDAFTGISVNWESIPVTVQYQAGYRKVPADLVDACLRLVTARFAARGRDPMLVQREQPNIGVQRWWVGSTPGQSGALPPEIAALIDQYRVPVTA